MTSSTEPRATVTTWPDGSLGVLLQRRELLRVLDHRPAEKHELEDDLGVSRSTVDRGVRELSQAGVIERTDEGYRPTLFGALAFGEFERLERRLGALERARPVLDGLDPDAARDLDAAMFDGAEVVTSTRSAPNRPAGRMMDLVEGATSVRALGAAVLPWYVDVYHQAIVERGMSAHVVLQSEAMEELLSNYDEAVEAMLATGRASLRLTGQQLPFGMVLADREGETELGIVVYADNGIHGFIGNDHAAAVQWGERFFEGWWECSDPVGPTSGADQPE